MKFIMINEELMLTKHSLMESKLDVLVSLKKLQEINILMLDVYDIWNIHTSHIIGLKDEIEKMNESQILEIFDKFTKEKKLSKELNVLRQDILEQELIVKDAQKLYEFRKKNYLKTRDRDDKFIL